MPRFSQNINNKNEGENKIPSGQNFAEETINSGPKFGNPSAIELPEEETKDSKPIDSLIEHTRGTDRLNESEKINQGTIKKLKNFLQINLPDSPYKTYLIFDVQYIENKEDAESFLNDISTDFIDNNQKKEMRSILGLSVEEGTRIPISKIETEKLNFNEGEKVVWTVSGNIYTVEKMMGDYVKVKELSSPLPLSTVEKIDTNKKPDNSFIEATRDMEREFDPEKLQQFNIPKIPDGGIKENIEPSKPIENAGEYPVVNIPDEEKPIQYRKPAFDVLDRQVESREKSLSEVKEYLLDYIESNLQNTDNVKALHYGIDLARSIMEVKSEIDDAFGNGIINNDQKDLVYHLAGLKENEDLNKLGQFEIPKLANEEETFEQMYERAKNKAEEEAPNQDLLNNLRNSVSGERKIKEEPRSDYNLEIFVPGINRAPYKVGDEASVIRSNHQIDSGWSIADIREGKVYLIKEHEPGQLMRKKVTVKDFIKEQILANKNNTEANESNDFVDVDIAREAGLNDEEIAYIKRGSKSGGLLTMSWQEVQKFNRLYDKYYDFKQKVENEKPLPPPAPENAKSIEVDNFEELFAKAEEIDKKLESAREAYTSARIEFLNKHRQKKNIFAKAMLDLGVEKQMPKSDEIPDEVKELERAYIEAKKEKSRYLFAKSSKKQEAVSTGMVIAETKEYSFNEDLVKELENEMERFNKAMESGRPPLERGVLSKTLEKWSKLSPTSRVLLSSALMTGVTVAFGAVPLAGAAVYGGYRAVRGLGGMVTSQAVGKGIQNRFDKSNELSKKEFEETYGRDITEENFAEKQKEAMDFYESEKEKKKRQLLKKATAMAATGAGFAVGSGALLHHVDGVLNAKVPLPETHSIKPSVPEGALKADAIETELSSKGFIKTFDEMKGKILEKYGNVTKVPDNLKHFVETPSNKLAEEFGMYDPDKNLSGVGLKGESLSLDTKGNLTYEHLSGKEDVLFDSQKGQASPFEGKLINSEGEVVPREYIGKTAPMDVDMGSDKVKIPETPSETPSNIPKNTESPKSKIIEIGGKPFASLDNLVVDNHNVGLADLDGKKVLVYDNQAIAQEVLDPKPGAYPMALADQLQEGKQFKGIREAFNVAMDKMVEGYKNVGYLSTGLPFEGGKIQVVTDASNEIGKTDIYLNGRHFASGVITEKGANISLDEGVKSSWWSGDNAYERAIKESGENIFPNISHLLKNQ